MTTWRKNRRGFQGHGRGREPGRSRVVASSLLTEELPTYRVPRTSLKRARKESGPLAENGSSRNCGGRERKARYKREKEERQREEEKKKKEENTRSTIITNHLIPVVTTSIQPLEVHSAEYI